jgi:hypothetical protein
MTMLKQIIWIHLEDQKEIMKINVGELVMNDIQECEGEGESGGKVKIEMNENNLRRPNMKYAV